MPLSLARRRRHLASDKSLLLGDEVGLPLQGVGLVLRLQCFSDLTYGVSGVRRAVGFSVMQRKVIEPESDRPAPNAVFPNAAEENRIGEPA